MHSILIVTMCSHFNSLQFVCETRNTSDCNNSDQSIPRDIANYIFYIQIKIYVSRYPSWTLESITTLKQPRTTIKFKVHHFGPVWKVKNFVDNNCTRIPVTSLIYFLSLLPRSGCFYALWHHWRTRLLGYESRVVLKLACIVVVKDL